MEEAISSNDAIVEDAGRLWRSTQNGANIYFKRFGMTYQQNVDRLRRKLDEWSLTWTGKNMAREQLRLLELDATE